MKRLALVPKGLRYKLMIAFCLMSLIPLLVSAYIVRDYIFPPTEDIINISWILFFCLIIAILGFVLARRMINPIVEMAVEARLIAEGDLNRRISVATEDEIGDLANAINELTLQIKENITELTSYGEKAKLIDAEIHRRVLALSNLLHIGEHISTSANIEYIIGLITEKIVQIMDTGYAMLFLPKPSDPATLEVHAADNVINNKLSGIEIRRAQGLLGALFESNSTLCADSKTGFLKEVEKFREEYKVKNFAALPIVSRNKVIGMLLYGNEIENYEFKEADLVIIKIFAKQAAIAYESDALSKKAKELVIKDDLTDLYNETYIKIRLDEEIKRAVLIQRPCSFIIFNVDNFNEFREGVGELMAEKALKKIASVLKDYVSQLGKAARLSGNEFALLLPEKNKKTSYKIAEEVRKKVENLALEPAKKITLTVSGGVSENPLDGSTVEDLIEKASQSVNIAKAQGKNRIV